MYENNISPLQVFKSFLHHVQPSLESHIKKIKRGYMVAEKNIRIVFDFFSNEVIVEKKENTFVGTGYEKMWHIEDRYALSLAENGNLRATRKI